MPGPSRYHTLPISKDIEPRALEEMIREIPEYTGFLCFTLIDGCPTKVSQAELNQIFALIPEQVQLIHCVPQYHLTKSFSEHDMTLESSMALLSQFMFALARPSSQIQSEFQVNESRPAGGLGYKAIMPLLGSVFIPQRKIVPFKPKVLSLDLSDTFGLCGPANKEYLLDIIGSLSTFPHISFLGFANSRLDLLSEKEISAFFTICKRLKITSLDLSNSGILERNEPSKLRYLPKQVQEITFGLEEMERRTKGERQFIAQSLPFVAYVNLINTTHGTEHLDLAYGTNRFAVPKQITLDDDKKALLKMFNKDMGQGHLFELRCTIANFSGAFSTPIIMGYLGEDIGKFREPLKPNLMPMPARLFKYEYGISVSSKLIGSQVSFLGPREIPERPVNLEHVGTPKPGK